MTAGRSGPLTARWRTVGVALAVAVGVGALPGMAPSAQAASQPVDAAAPTLAEQAPEGVTFPANGKVDEQRGDFTHRYEFTLPEGRMGFTPALGLTYSSANAVHGGVAAGWELPVPAIKADRRAGSQRLADAYGSTPDGFENFVTPSGDELVPDSSLPVVSGARGFRAVYDGSYARFEFLGGVSGEEYWWRVRTRDGVTRYFGDRAEHPYTYAPLLREESPHGDATTYSYATVGRDDAEPGAGDPREFRLDRIDYANPVGAVYASVIMSYADPVFCPAGGGDTAMQLPLGGRLDYGLGFGRLSGTRKLQYVSTWRARESSAGGGFAKIREYELGYDASTECQNTSASPFRQLLSVQESAVSPNIPVGEPGHWTVKPPTEFTYGKAAAYTTSGRFGPAQPLVLPSPDAERAQYGPMPLSKGADSGYLWVDVNGDNLVDILEDDPATNRGAGEHELNCMVNVFLNQGDGTFEKNSDEFPEFFVYDASADVPVNYPDDTYLCSLTKSMRTDGTETTGANIYRTFFDADLDGLVDMVAQPVVYQGWYESTYGIPRPESTEFPFEDENWDEGLFFGDDDDGKSTYAVQKRWYVYRNNGSGFDAEPVVMNPHPEGVKVQPPNALFGIGGRSTDTGNDPVTRLDLDGDGKPDYLGEVGGDDVLMRGKPQGGYAEVGVPWGLGRSKYNSSTVTDYDETGFRYEQIAGLADINGDGLPDQVFRYDPPLLDDVAEVYLNRGRRFGREAGKPDFDLARGYGDKAVMLWKGSSDSKVDNPRDYRGGTAGRGQVTRSTADVDYDGYPDLVGIDAVGDDGFALLGNGTGWAAERSLDQAVAPFYLGASMELTVPSYEAVSHMYPVDLNGDGLLDLVGDADEDSDAEVRFAKPVLDHHPDHAAPARLLRTVSNGYGAKTTVSYERAPAAERWVVSRVENDPGQGQPSSGFRYSYGDAVRNADAYGNTGFRGFDTVTAVNFGNGLVKKQLSSVHTRYDYRQDHRGLPDRTVIARGPEGYDPATEQHVLKITDHGYLVRHLPTATRPEGMRTSFPLRTVLPDRTSVHTCRGDGGEPTADCDVPANRILHRTVYGSVFRDGKFVLDAPRIFSEVFRNAEGRTETRSREIISRRLSWTPQLYRLAVHDTRRMRAIAGSAEQIGETHYRYQDDGSNGGTYSLLRTVSVEDGTGREATTYTQRFSSGAATGQVHKEWQPEQFATAGTGGAHTTTVYDAFGLHPVRVTNPVGHVTETDIDPGTGATLEVRGPNYGCADGTADCAFDEAAMVEKTTHAVDGFGRTLRTTRTPLSGGSPVVTARATFDDGAFHTSGEPVTATAETLTEGTEYSLLTTEYDGLGRVLRTAVDQSPHPAQETRYRYDALGGLAATSVAAPAGAGTVDYRFERDALGRPVKLYGPTATGNEEKLLSESVYDGFTTTTKESITDTYAPATEKSVTRDAAGQVVTVDERKDADSFATTRYRYDGNGNVTELRDPDGVVTTMTHDWAGHRTSVTSSGEMWSYGYDRNGNQVTVTEPHPTGKSAAYTRVTSYDALNRPVARIPAVRDLSSEEQEELKHGPTGYFYDQAHPSLTGRDTLQQIGRLSYTTSPVATVVHRYDHLGHQAGTSQQLSRIGGIAETAETLDHARGATRSGLLDSDWYASNEGYVGAPAYYDYDKAGQAYRLRTRLETKVLTVAELTRNGVGLVTRRVGNPVGVSGFAQVQVDFGYAPSGQLSSQTVEADGRQTYAYRVGEFTYNGRVLFTREKFGDEAAVWFGYAYDHRNQLIEAGDLGTAVNYYGRFAYTAGGRLAATNVGSSEPGARIAQRNVTHTYDPDHPRRLTALTKPDDTDLAGYSYDRAGNTVERRIEGESITQRWDGLGRLAKVIRADGSAETYFYDGSERVAVLRTDSEGRTVEVRRTFGELQAVYTPDDAPRYRRQLTLEGNVGRIDGKGTEGRLEYHYTSPQGHQVLALDATDGAIRRATSYGPFGDVLRHRVADDAEPGSYAREFNGKEYDSFSGYHHYGHRYYDPLAIRWSSTDPLYRLAPALDVTDPRSANLYTFTRNNPVHYTDPDGLDSGRVVGPGIEFDGRARKKLGKSPDLRVVTGQLVGVDFSDPAGGFAGKVGYLEAFANGEVELSTLRTTLGGEEVLHAGENLTVGFEIVGKALGMKFKKDGKADAYFAKQKLAVPITTSGARMEVFGEVEINAAGVKPSAGVTVDGMGVVEYSAVQLLHSLPVDPDQEPTDAGVPMSDTVTFPLVGTTVDIPILLPEPAGVPQAPESPANDTEFGPRLPTGEFYTDGAADAARWGR